MAALGILLLTIGAVLTFAIEAGVEGVDLDAVGVIFMVTGGIAFVTGAIRGSFAGLRTRRERAVSADGHHVVEEERTSSV